MINIIKVILVSSAILLLINACGDKVDAVQESADNSKNDTSISESAVSYSADIQPILESRCLGCHSENKQGADRNGARVGVDFDTYELAKENAVRANSRIQNGSMPPSGPIPEEEKQIFQMWIDQDTPE